MLEATTYVTVSAAIPCGLAVHARNRRSRPKRAFTTAV